MRLGHRLDDLFTPRKARADKALRTQKVAPLMHFLDSANPALDAAHE